MSAILVLYFLYFIAIDCTCGNSGTFIGQNQTSCLIRFN